MVPPLRIPTLFPYTTLFRSSARRTCCTRRRPPPRDRGCSYWPRLPEVVVEAAAFVDAAERQLERHVDLDPLGLAVRQLAVEPAAALQVDHRVRGGRVRALEEIVVGEGEELPAQRELHLLEPARVRALDAHAVLRELHGTALGALAAVEREELPAVAEHDDGRGQVARRRLLAHELPEARVAPVGRERALHLDLLRDGGARGRRRRGHAQEERVGAIAIARDQDEVTRFRALERGRQHEEGLRRPRVADRRPEAVLELPLRIETERPGDRLRRAWAGGGKDDGGEGLRRDLGLGEHALHRLAEDAAVAVCGLERARAAPRELLLPRPPRAEELVCDRVRGDHLGPSRAAAEQHRRAGIAVALLDGRVGLAEAALARGDQHAP